MPTFQHVVYLTGGGEVIELFAPLGTDGWKFKNIRDRAGAPFAAAGSALTSWVDPTFLSANLGGPFSPAV